MPMKAYYKVRNAYYETPGSFKDNRYDLSDGKYTEKPILGSEYTPPEMYFYDNDGNIVRKYYANSSTNVFFNSYETEAKTSELYKRGIRPSKIKSYTYELKIVELKNTNKTLLPVNLLGIVKSEYSKYEWSSDISCVNGETVFNVPPVRIENEDNFVRFDIIPQVEECKVIVKPIFYDGNKDGENDFAPDSNITREQIAVIMHRYAKYKGYDVSVGESTNIHSYTDFDEISEYAISAMQWAVGSGLMKGKTETTINPKDFATRAEIAAILQRFIESNK